MFRARSAISFLVAVFLCLSALTGGCGLIDRSDRDIITAVTAYLDEIQSGTFAENRYLSTFAKDTPFSIMTFKDEATLECMNTSLRKIRFEIVESSGNKSDRTGMCTVLLTLVDVDKILKTMKNEWITEEELSRAIDSAEAPTVEEEVILFTEYDPAADAWIISDSASIAVALGVPYSKINLFSKAGPPEEAFEQFMDALESGEAEKIAPFIKTYSSYSSLFPEDIEMSVRQAFFGQIDYEIGDVEIFGDTCEMEVLLDYPDMQVIADGLIQNQSLLCEMFKYLFTVLLAEGQSASLDKFEVLNTQLWLANIEDTNAARLQENFVFTMIPAEEGTQWRIKSLPSFMTETYASGDEPGEEASYSAAGMALIELCDEGIITEETRDKGLAEYGLQHLKYSTRQVVESYAAGDMIDMLGNGDGRKFNSETSEGMCVSIEFHRDWPELVLNVWLYEDGSEEPLGYYIIEAEPGGLPNLFFAYLSYMDGKEWPKGKYRLEIRLEDRTLLDTLSFEIV